MLNFDDQDGQIWFDGALRPWRSVNLHVLTHGLHYGSCVFEGERVYSGRVFHLRQHTERLINSAGMLGFKIPWSLEEIEQATRETVAAQGYADAYVRPVAWRGSEMMGVSAQKSRIHLAIAVWEWPSYFSPEARMKGIRLKWSSWKRPSPDCFLDGITRRSVIRLARARGYEIVERAIMPDELSKAAEIFVTGTAAEVTPVGQIDEMKFAVGPITRALMQDYEKLVRRPETAASSAA